MAPHRNGMDSPPEPSPYYIESQKFHDQDIQVDFASMEKTDSPTQTPLLRQTTVQSLGGLANVNIMSASSVAGNKPPTTQSHQRIVSHIQSVSEIDANYFTQEPPQPRKIQPIVFIVRNNSVIEPGKKGIQKVGPSTEDTLEYYLTMSDMARLIQIQIACQNHLKTKGPRETNMMQQTRSNKIFEKIGIAQGNLRPKTTMLIERQVDKKIKLDGYQLN